MNMVLYQIRNQMERLRATRIEHFEKGEDYKKFRTILN